MTARISFEDLGSMDYKEAWDYQVSRFDERVAQKLINRECPPEERVYPDNRLLFVEHPHVYTLGKSGNQNQCTLPTIYLCAELCP